MCAISTELCSVTKSLSRITFPLLPVFIVLFSAGPHAIQSNARYGREDVFR